MDLQSDSAEPNQIAAFPSFLHLLRLLLGVGEALEQLLDLLLLVVEMLLVALQAVDELFAVREAPVATAMAVISTHR